MTNNTHYCVLYLLYCNHKLPPPPGKKVWLVGLQNLPHQPLGQLILALLEPGLQGRPTDLQQDCQIPADRYLNSGMEESFLV